MINLNFKVDGTAEMHLIRYPRRDMTPTRFERHLTMTETRVALGDSAIMVVAGDTPLDDRTALPEPGSVRAFLLSGNQGLLLHRGTWHDGCYPTSASHADFAFFTEKEAEDEFACPKPFRYERTHVIDFAKTAGITFKVTDPKGLIASMSDASALLAMSC
jgi:ureidoglycolate hydrolase